MRKVWLLLIFLLAAAQAFAGNFEIDFAGGGVSATAVSASRVEANGASPLISATAPNGTVSATFGNFLDVSATNLYGNGAGLTGVLPASVGWTSITAITVPPGVASVSNATGPVSATSFVATGLVSGSTFTGTTGYFGSIYVTATTGIISATNLYGNVSASTVATGSLTASGVISGAAPNTSGSLVWQANTGQYKTASGLAWDLTNLAVPGNVSITGNVSASNVSVTTQLQAQTVSATQAVNTVAVSTSTLKSTGLLTASGGITTTAVTATTVSGTLAAGPQNNITTATGLTSVSDSGPLNVGGAISASAATFNGALTANSGLTSTAITATTSLSGSLVSGPQNAITQATGLTTVSDSGPLNVGGAISATGATNLFGQLTVASTVSIGNIVTATMPSGTLTALTLQVSDTNYFEGFNIQNKSAGAGASSDGTFTANDGSANTWYLSEGINGSGGGNSPWTTGHDAYLYAFSTTTSTTPQGTHIGSLGSGGYVDIAVSTGIVAAPVPILTVTSAGVSMTGLEVATNISASGGVSVTGNLSASKLIGDCSLCTGISAGGTPDTVISGTGVIKVISTTSTISFTEGNTNVAFMTSTSLQVSGTISATVANIGGVKFPATNITKTIITATGSFSFTTGADIVSSSVIQVDLVGAGGAGSTATTCTGGGAGGADCKVRLTGAVLQPNTTYSGVIGTGGATHDVSGTATTLTVAGTTYTAGGGGVWPNNASVRALGGTTTNCDADSVNGGDGEPPPAGTGSNPPGYGGNAGGGWGNGGVPANGANTFNGTGFGSGGAGECSSHTPGTGANGLAVFTRVQ